MRSRTQARIRSARSLLVGVVLLVTAACSTPPKATNTLSRPTPAPTPTTASDVISIEGRVMGVGEYPHFTVEAPNTWSLAGESFVVKDAGPVLGVSVWDVGEVPRHPCHWEGNSFDPGPTVENLVDALVAQKLRNATEPIPVSLGGHDGMYLEWSVPADWVVTGDADFEGCDVEPSNGHLDFISFYGNGIGERYQQVAGQVDRLWILDVDGQRLLVDATYSPDASLAERDELEAIAESIRFVDAV